MRRLLLAVPLALLLLVPLASAQTASGPVALTLGDFWNLRSETITGVASNVESTHVEVLAPEHIVVENVSYEALRTRDTTVIYNNVTLSRTQTFSNTTTWLRPSDQAVIQTRHTSESSVGSSDTTTIDSPPCVWMQFPLTVGAKWSVTCNEKVNGQTFTSTTNYTVLKYETVQVAAGTFDAFKIEYAPASDTTIDFWYAPQACHEIKTVVTTTGTTTSSRQTTELTAYKCAATSTPTPTPTPTVTPTPTATPTPSTPASTPASTPSSTPAATTPGATPAATPQATPSPSAKPAPGPAAALTLAIVAGVAVAIARRRS